MLRYRDIAIRNATIYRLARWATIWTLIFTICTPLLTRRGKKRSARPPAGVVDSSSVEGRGGSGQSTHQTRRASVATVVTGNWSSWCSPLTACAGRCSHAVASVLSGPGRSGARRRDSYRRCALFAEYVVLLWIRCKTCTRLRYRAISRRCDNRRVAASAIDIAISPNR